MSRPTLRDVAATAGLSVTQVSRALNGHDDVAEATREHARQVAAELGYAPNLDARRLRSPDGRRGTIGIVLPSDQLRFSDPFFGELLSAMVDAAAEHGLQLVLSTHADGANPVEPYESALRHRQVDGFVILRTVEGDQRIDFLVGRGFPFVAFGRPEGMNGFAAVEPADDCFDELVDHLATLGHRRLGCIAEPVRFANGAARLRSFLRSAERCGLRPRPEHLVEAGFHERSGFDAARVLLQTAPAPTAIVAMNDLLAFGALDAAAELDVSVPGQVSITGFDDVPAARHIRPALTTVRQSAAEVGAALLDQLLPQIERGASQHRAHRISSSLVVRSSSASPAAVAVR